MFGDMNGQDALHLRAPQDRSPASFDAEFLRSLRVFLERDLFEREGIDPSRLGRMVVGDPGMVRQCLVDGCDVQPDTADGVHNAAFVQRLQRGSSPNLRTVDRVRGWMHSQLRGGQRRTVFAAVTEPIARRQPVARRQPRSAACNRIRNLQGG